MFDIIKNSYKLLVLKFPQILWITSGLLFLELGSRWLIVNRNETLWWVLILGFVQLVTFFTKIFVIIDLNKLVLSEKTPPIKNAPMLYMKVLGFTFLLNGICYAIIILIEYLIPEASLTTIPSLIIQLVVGFFIFVYIYAHINIAIPMIMVEQNLTKLFSITKDRYTGWLLVCLLIYQPFIILNLFALTSYLLIIAKVFFFCLIYIFGAFYLKNKINN